MGWFSKDKKNICEFCGTEIPMTVDNHYIGRDDGDTPSAVNSLFSTSNEEQLYDCFDCPTCGCQMVAQTRKRKFMGGKNDAKSKENSADGEIGKKAES